MVVAPIFELGVSRANGVEFSFKASAQEYKDCANYFRNVHLVYLSVALERQRNPGAIMA